MYSAEEFDNLKQKVLKYVFYKKRTEQEVRTKFQDQDEDMMEDMIEFLKEEKYLDDSDYIYRSVREFMALRNLSLKEIKYKLYQKGIDQNLIEDFFSNNSEEMLEYEINSAKNIIQKRMGSNEIEDIKNFLFKKGYSSESIKEALEGLE